MVLWSGYEMKKTTHDYKEGYDFGVGLHTEIEETQELENQELREQVRGEDKFYERRK